MRLGCRDVQPECLTCGTIAKPRAPTFPLEAALVVKAATEARSDVVNEAPTRQTCGKVRSKSESAIPPHITFLPQVSTVLRKRHGSYAIRCQLGVWQR